MPIFNPTFDTMPLHEIEEWCHFLTQLEKQTVTRMPIFQKRLRELKMERLLLQKSFEFDYLLEKENGERSIY